MSGLWRGPQSVFRRLSQPDAVLRRLCKDASALLGAGVLANALGLVSLSLSARYLGPERLGTLHLVQTYVLTVGAIGNWQIWQAIIRYGAAAQANDCRDDYEAVVKFGLVLDVASGLASALVAVALVPVVGRIYHWDAIARHMAAVYSIALVFSLKSAPIAVLQLAGRFKLIGALSVTIASAKLVGVAMLARGHASLAAFLYLSLGTDLLNAGLLLGAAQWQLRHLGHRNVLRASLRGLCQRCPGLWQFAISTNITLSVRTSIGQFDSLLVGGLLGPQSVGLYYAAKKLASLPFMLHRPLYQALYPTLASSWSKGSKREFALLIVKTSLGVSLLVLGFWLLCVAFGGQLLLLTSGPDFVAAKPVLVWYMLGCCIQVMAVPLVPAMLAMGRAGSTLALHLVTSAVYLLALALGLRYMGLLAAGPAVVLYYGLDAIGFAGLTYRFWRRHDPPTASSREGATEQVGEPQPA